MQRMIEYFERGFIGVINNNIEITIYDDQYDDNNKLVNLICNVDENIIEPLDACLNKVVDFKVTGAKTKKRKEEFEYKRRIKINKISLKSNIDEKRRLHINVTEEF